METGFDQGGPGLHPAHPVDAQASLVLEGFDRGTGTGAEEAVGIDGDAPVSQGGQAVLDVGDGLAPVTQGEGESSRRDRDRSYR
jgi:hypothetical protein